jgi:5'(3')-deoxyribonucleotidase
MLRVSIGIDVDKSQMTTDREFNNSICGTEDYIINKIKELEAMGITDILISNTYENITEIDKTNALVDRYKSL